MRRSGLTAYTGFMSEDEVEVENQPEDHAPETQGTPLWAKAMVVVALLFLVVGFSMKADAKVVEPSQGGSVATEGVLSTNTLVAGGQNPDVWDGSEGAQAESGGLSDYSPFFIKSGFSFLVLFFVGMAARMFFKIGGLFVGVLALVLIGMNELGWIVVHWDVMSDQWDSVAGKIVDQADGLKTFITGSLPAAGAGSVGLFAGFKKG